jgi:histone H3/H4
MILSYEGCDVITTATSATQFITTLAVTWATAEGRELISNEDVIASMCLISTIGQ